jgi:hypothetical protein
MYKKNLKQLILLGLLLMPYWVSAQTEANNISQEVDSKAAEWLQGSYRYNTVSDNILGYLVLFVSIES